MKAFSSQAEKLEQLPADLPALHRKTPETKQRRDTKDNNNMNKGSGKSVVWTGAHKVIADRVGSRR